MARSSYIYIVRMSAGHYTVAPFTVKHEMHSFLLQYSDEALDRMVVETWRHNTPCPEMANAKPAKQVKNENMA